MSSAFTAPEVCPVCGGTVPRRAKCCPDCGADERSGWDEAAARYDGLDLPEETAGRNRQKASQQLLWLVVAIAVLAALVLNFVFRR